MRLKTIIILLFLSKVFLGQKDTILDKSIKTPFNKNSHNRNLAIKGKILPFVFGNDLGINGLLGIEYGFLKNQTIGIDGYCLYTNGSHDKIQDTAGVEHEVGNFHSSIDKAIFINYRYYLKFNKLRDNKGLSLFTGCFYRYGQIKSSTDPAYKNDFVTSVEVHNSFGVLFGGIYNIRKRLGIDFDLGLFYKHKNINSTYIENHEIKYRTENPTNFGMRIGLNLIYWINL